MRANAGGAAKSHLGGPVHVETGIMGNALSKAAAVDFLIQWSMFLLAAYMKSEKFFDATGSATFVLLLLQSLLLARKFFPRQVIQSGMVCTWASRLGLFLVARVLRDGRDRRFNRVRDNPRRFFLFWTMQGYLSGRGVYYTYYTNIIWDVYSIR